MTTIAAPRLPALPPAMIGAVALGSAVFAGVIAAAGTGAFAPRLPLPLAIHLASVVPALPLGGYVLLRRKGDRLHKLLGRIWAVLMLAAAISSFWLGAGLSPIHILSLFVLVGIPLSVVRARRGDIVRHRRGMEAVYIGLVLAGAFAFLPMRLLGSALFG